MKLAYSVDENRDFFTSNQSSNSNKHRFSFTSEQKNGSVAVHYNIPAEQTFQFASLNKVDSSHIVGEGTAANPFLQFTNEDAMHTVVTHGKKGAPQFRFGAFFGKEKNLNAFDDPNEVQENNIAFAFEASQKFADDKASLSFQGGMLKEYDSFLGSRTDGAFATEQGIATNFYGIAGSYQLTDKITWFGNMLYGCFYSKSRSILIVNKFLFYS